MRDFAFRLVQLLGTGLILGFFSEFYFLNEGPVADLEAGLHQNPATALLGLAELGGFYALFAFGFLAALDRFRVHTLSGLLLAGAIYGLAAEALVVPVVYEAMPVSLVWTSLSWHTLVDVLAGWYLLRRLMRSASAAWAAAALVLLGGIWGYWATWNWVDASQAALTLGQFATMSLVSSLLLLVGMVLADLRPVRQFHPSRAELWLGALASAALLILTGLPYGVLMLAVPALLGLIFAALGAQKAACTPADAGVLEALDRRPPAARYLLLPLLPLSAIAAYGLVLKTGARVATDEIVPLLTFLGAASFLWALAASVWRRIRLVH